MTTIRERVFWDIWESTKRKWRRVPESNRCTRICNPVHNHSANAPYLEFDGAPGRTWTGTTRKSRDFKSLVSTNFTTRATHTAMATPSVHHIAVWTRRTLAKSAPRSIKNYQLIYRLLNKTTLTYRWATICTFIPHHKDFWALCLSLTFSKMQLKHFVWHVLRFL